jgi:F-type H+-transporting ATPase subunit b
LRITIRQSRWSHRILGLALLTVLTAGLAMVPLRSAAQQADHPAAAPASSNQAAPDQADGKAAKPKPETAEEDEESTYLHTPLVASIGRALHLSVETTAKVFLFVNFAVIALAIVIPIAKILPKVMRKRSTTLSQNLETARKTTADANARLGAVEAQLSRLDEEIAKIRAQVEQESVQDAERIKATIEEERARIVASAEQEISVAAAQAKRGLRHFAADLAIDRAVRQLDLTPEADRALIAEFVSETAQNGGAEGKPAGKMDGNVRGGKN